jgi:cytochrome c-type biogenesis protein CcmH
MARSPNPAFHIVYRLRHPWLAVLLSLAAVFLMAGVVLAQEATPIPVTDDQVNAIARQLYCPVCENVPLDVCPTQACAQWRALIRDKLSQGWSESQIKAYFVEQYGDRVLAAPPARGINWLVYLVPPLAILAGVFILYRALMIWRQAPAEANSGPGSPAAPPANDEYVQRLEEELRKST